MLFVLVCIFALFATANSAAMARVETNQNPSKARQHVTKELNEVWRDTRGDFNDPLMQNAMRGFITRVYDQPGLIPSVDEMIKPLGDDLLRQGLKGIDLHAPNVYSSAEAKFLLLSLIIRKSPSLCSASVQLEGRCGFYLITGQGIHRNRAGRSLSEELQIFLEQHPGMAPFRFRVARSEPTPGIDYVTWLPNPDAIAELREQFPGCVTERESTNRVPIKKYSHIDPAWAKHMRAIEEKERLRLKAERKEKIAQEQEENRLAKQKRREMHEFNRLFKLNAKEERQKHLEAAQARSQIAQRRFDPIQRSNNIFGTLDRTNKRNEQQQRQRRAAIAADEQAKLIKAKRKAEKKKRQQSKPQPKAKGNRNKGNNK